jgi:thymidylate synthase (FAD)
MNKKPEIKLFSITNDPLECIALSMLAWENSTIPSTPEEIDLRENELVEMFRKMMKVQHQTGLEYVNTVWTMKNVSRAFQQQLTRHRIGFSYSIQSLRVVDVGNFADNYDYYMPSTVKDKRRFHEAMLDTQYNYRKMISLADTSEKIEDARGILPLNIFSHITMSCSYRALLALIKQRMCVIAQEEWKEVVKQIRSELEKIHPVLVEPFDCACGRFKNGKGVCKTSNKPVTMED